MLTFQTLLFEMLYELYKRVFDYLDKKSLYNFSLISKTSNIVFLENVKLNLKFIKHAFKIRSSKLINLIDTKYEDLKEHNHKILLRCSKYNYNKLFIKYYIKSDDYSLDMRYLINWIIKYNNKMMYKFERVFLKRFRKIENLNFEFSQKLYIRIFRDCKLLDYFIDTGLYKGLEDYSHECITKEYMIKTLNEYSMPRLYKELYINVINENYVLVHYIIHINGIDISDYITDLIRFAFKIGDEDIIHLLLGICGKQDLEKILTFYNISEENKRTVDEYLRMIF